MKNVLIVSSSLRGGSNSEILAFEAERGAKDAGQVIASGVWPVGAVNNTEYPKQAYQLGKSI